MSTKNVERVVFLSLVLDLFGALCSKVAVFIEVTVWLPGVLNS